MRNQIFHRVRGRGRELWEILTNIKVTKHGKKNHPPHRDIHILHKIGNQNIQAKDQYNSQKCPNKAIWGKSLQKYHRIHFVSHLLLGMSKASSVWWMYSESPLVKTNFPFARCLQLQITSWSEIGARVHFPVSALIPSGLNLYYSYTVITMSVNSFVH